MPYYPILKNQHHRLDHVPPRFTTERILDTIPGFVVWCALIGSIICAVYSPQILLYFATLLAIYNALRFLYAGIAIRGGLKQIEEWERRDWDAFYKEHYTAHTLDWGFVRHLVIIPNYNESVEVLRRTLNSLKAQYQAKERLIVILAMEERDRHHAVKADILLQEFKTDFKFLFSTVHPESLPGEMACKSANQAWAARWAKHKLVDELGYDLDSLVVTTMDADTQWHPIYFKALTTIFALSPERHCRFWQGAIRYHGNIWQINPVLGMLNAYATAFELAYLSIKWWLVMPISSYSLSLRLLHESGYWDGDVIADEWHMYIKSYFARRGDVKVEEIMLPFSADVPAGNNFFEELKERYQQTLRHAWGSKEITYMMANLISGDDVRLFPALRRMSRISHDILMAGAGWVILTLGSQLPILLHPEIAPFDPRDIADQPGKAAAIIARGLMTQPVWIVLSLSFAVVIILSIIFWYQDMRARPPRPELPATSQTLLTLLGFFLLPITTLVVLALPVIEAQTRLMLGIPLHFRVSKKRAR